MKLKKFTPELAEAIVDAGYDQFSAIQELAIPKIRSGADLFIIGEKGSGKSTALVMSIIQQLKEAVEEAPRALIVVNSKEKAYELEELFQLLGRNTNLRTFVVFDKGILQYQKNMIYEGLDILIGTPKRIDELMSTTGIPMVKIRMLAFDDVDFMVTQLQQKLIYRLVYALPKVQTILLAEEWSERFDELEERALKSPLIVECEEDEEAGFSDEEEIDEEEIDEEIFDEEFSDEELLDDEE
ncbi:MAG: DEAD/DEAH box helicase [Mangrovibacterium sp.]